MQQDHAVVIGGSIAGLVAARILARHFHRVTLVERDLWPASAEPRRGLPQAHHQHILLLRGRQLLEQLFPGFDAELAELGAPRVDYLKDCLLVSTAGALPRFPSRLELRLCRRPVIDRVLLRRLQAEPGLELRSECRALALTADRGRITGLTLDSGPALAADLVVDASGRGSRTPAWLGQLGYQRPPAEVVNPFLGYASRLYAPPPGWAGGWRALEVAARPTHNPRAAGLWEVEQGRWLLTLIGTARVYPPEDEDGFLEFARRLPDPRVFEAIQGARPLSAIHGYRGLDNRWQHYERLRRFPDGLVVLGDALCAFNPTHGQGMTLAALGGQVLDRQLRAGLRPGLGPRVHAELAARVKPVWRLAISDDLRWPGTEGGRPDWSMRLFHRYQDLVTPLGLDNPELVETFLAVAHLVEPPSALFRPGLLARLFRQWLVRGRRW